MHQWDKIYHFVLRSHISFWNNKKIYHLKQFSDKEKKNISLKKTKKTKRNDIPLNNQPNNEINEDLFRLEHWRKIDYLLKNVLFHTVDAFVFFQQ